MLSPVTLAIPCRTDEPALRRTLENVWTSFARAGVPVTTAVCLNGDGVAACSARREIDALATTGACVVSTVDVDRSDAAGTAFVPRSGALVVAHTRRAGKAVAWNILRARVATEIVVFLDADVTVGTDAVGRLLGALERAPSAILASPKTTCAARDTWFERIMAAPYAVDFPNLSGQLYAARLHGLPPRMPEDLIEPERWLELACGREAVVRDPGATVTVRLPGTLRDFYRQRVRIEMGKVQLDAEYPELSTRGAPQPRLRATLATLSPAGLARLGAYLALRESAHVVARWRYRARRTEGVWVQASSTKEWRT